MRRKTSPGGVRGLGKPKPKEKRGRKRYFQTVETERKMLQWRMRKSNSRRPEQKKPPKQQKQKIPGEVRKNKNPQRKRNRRASQGGGKSQLQFNQTTVVLHATYQSLSADLFSELLPSLKKCQVSRKKRGVRKSEGI